MKLIPKWLSLKKERAFKILRIRMKKPNVKEWHNIKRCEINKMH